MKKRGQFFILAAVIISAIVLSFGYTINEAKVNMESDNFRDFSYEVKKEAGAVLDYEIYTDIQGSGSLDDFVRALSADLMDRDPDANFVFLYGNNSNLSIYNSGQDDVYYGENTVSGSSRSSDSTIGILPGIYTISDSEGSDFDDDYGYDNYGCDNCDEDSVSEVQVTISGQDLAFNFTRYRQVVFIMQKEVGDENFVSYK